MPEFTSLVAAAALWFGIHPVIAGSRLRDRCVGRLGEGGFRGLFSLLSLVALVWLVHAYSRAPFYPLWFAPRPVYYVVLLLMPLAVLLLAGAFLVPNPTAVGAEKVLERPEPARGALRITRHPFLWAVVLWGTAHVLVNGDVASLLFFGSLALTALVGTFDIDRKRQRAAPEAWERYRAITSSIPFAALAEGRNKLVVRELVKPLLVAIVLTGLVLHFHASWFGVSPLPR